MDRFIRNIIILFLFSLALLFIFFTFYIPISQDEGVFITISKGILKGLLPYKDFFDHKPPGIFFLLMPFIVLGKSFFSFRIFVLLVNIFTSLFVYKISENFKKGTGLLASVSYLFIVYIFEGYYIIAEPFLALILSSSFLILLKYKSKKYYILFGFLIFLALLIKQPAIISVTLLLFFAYFNENNLQNFKYILLGALVPFLTLLLWIFVNNIEIDFLEQVFFSSLYYPKHNIVEVFIKIGSFIFNSWYIWFFFLYFIFFTKIINKKILLLLALLPIPVYLIRDYPHYWIQSLPFLAVASSIGFNKLFYKNKIIVISLFSLFVLTSVSTLKWFSWMYKNVWHNQNVEQSDARVFINSLDSENIFAENRFISFYIFSNKDIVSKYLYTTEITNHYDSEEEVLNRLTKIEDIVILWPSDGNVYSRKIENYVRSLSLIKNYNSLKMDVYKKD